MTPNEIARALRAARKRKSLSQVHLAVRSGLSLPTVSLAERSGHLTQRTAERLAAALDVPVESLWCSGTPPAVDAVTTEGQDESSEEGA